ncbi:MAG TPA: AraC family transcriptional regulator, partial [Candidatus Blautia stercoravium]|nr:AraC family transcriptional regulator [Candidatus Blautia stercoravium]
MELTQLDMKKIKSLHVTTKLPVYIIDKDNCLVTSYCSSYAHPLSYKLTEKKFPSRYVSFYYGILGEVFLAVRYKDISVIMGPYLTCHVSDKDLITIFNTLSPQQQRTLEKMNYQSYYHSMPVYSLGDMR